MLARSSAGDHAAHQQGAGAVAVEGDASSLEHVILNLVTNARDAMPAGGEIEVETANRLAPAPMATAHGATPGRYVVVAVKDQGTGIPAGVLDRIFEPFFTTKPGGQGTGLGLSTIYNLVHQHRGWVEVESEVAEGRSFSVLIPAS